MYRYVHIFIPITNSIAEALLSEVRAKHCQAIDPPKAMLAQSTEKRYTGQYAPQKQHPILATTDM